MWWTITGNFGNILPIDWSKSYARQLHTKSLNLGEKRVSMLPIQPLKPQQPLHYYCIRGILICTFNILMAVFCLEDIYASVFALHGYVMLLDSSLIFN